MGLFFTVIWMHRCREESGVARAVAMVLECRVSVFFGTISYALYLIHEEMGIYVFFFGFCGGATEGGEVLPPGFGISPIPPEAAIFITTCISVILAIGITFLIERPVMFRLRAWYKRRAASSSA